MMKLLVILLTTALFLGDIFAEGNAIAAEVNEAESAPSTCPIDSLGREDRLPMHSAGKDAALGKWRVTDEALRDQYQGVSREDFMGYEMTLAPGKSIFVGDLYYEVGNTLGYQTIPLTDGPGTLADGRPGYAEIDDFLRKVMKLGPEDEIFTYITYNHPELHAGTLQSSESDLLTEGRQTHSGAYIGRGRTRNSPYFYHERVFSAPSYPMTFQILVVRGMDQAELNLNSVQWMEILNDGVEFPLDYKKDPVATPTLASIAEFAKSWVTRRDEVTGFEMATYCAEHQNMHANLTANIPLNEAFFESIPELGPELWESVKLAHLDATGRPLIEVDLEKYGEPLFRRAGLGSPFAATKVGQAMVWPPEATSDLVVNFVETYVPFVEAGGVAGATAILAFRSTVEQRMDLTPENLRSHLELGPDDEVPTLIAGFGENLFLAAALPVINILQIADAFTADLSTDEDIDAFVSERRNELAYAYGLPKLLQLPQGTYPLLTDEGDLNEELIVQLTADLQEGIRAAWQLAGVSVEAFRNERIRSLVKKCNIDRELAWSWLRKDIKPVLDAARMANVSDDVGRGIVRWNFPPAIFHRVAMGMVPRHPDVRIVEVAQGHEAAELEPFPGGEYVIPSLTW